MQAYAESAFLPGIMSGDPSLPLRMTLALSPLLLRWGNQDEVPLGIVALEVEGREGGGIVAE